MKVLFVISLCSFLSFAIMANEVSVRVSLSPAGSFEAKSAKLKGEVKKNKQGYTAEQLWVKVEELKTGIDLRDEHFKKHLNYEKYPKIIFTDIKAENGKGSGTLNVNDVKKPVNFTYKMISDKKVEATFKVKATDFNLKEAKYMEIGVENEIEIVASLDV